MILDALPAARFARFITVGLSNTFISFIVFQASLLLLEEWSFRAGASQVVSYSAGVFWSYYWNRRWSFQSTGKVRNELFRFIAIQLLCLVLSASALAIASDYGRFPATATWVVVMIGITVLNYLLLQGWVFRSERSSSNESRRFAGLKERMRSVTLRYRRVAGLRFDTSARTGNVAGLWRNRHLYSDKILVGMASLVTALSFGLSYGDGGSNHPVYLISGLRIRTPEFLANDWWAAQTSHYHHAFAYLIAGLSGLNALPWSMAVGNILALLLVLVLLFHMLSLLDRNHAPFTWMIVAALFFCIDGTRSVAKTYLFSPSLQPSTLSSTFFFAAMVFYIKGRHPLSGLFMGISSAFHSNFMLLGFPFFGLSHLMLGKGRLPSRLFKQFAPSMVVLAFQLPGIFHTMGLDLSEEVKIQANTILIDVAVPFHYKPMTFLIDFAALFGWCLIAYSVIGRVMDGREFARRFKSLFGSSLALIIAATLLTTIVFVGSVSRLFVWRLAPFCMLFAYIVVAEAAVRIFTLKGKEKSFPGPWNIVGCIIGFTMVLPFMVHQRMIFTGSGHLATPSAGMIFLGAGFAGLWWLAKFKGAGFHFPKGLLSPNRVKLFLAIALAIAVADDFSLRRFNLLHRSNPAEIELYDWAARTDMDSLFMVPPEMISFRLFGRRAVVAESKAVPFRPDEILEWHQRMKDICGEENAGSLKEMEKGYLQMDSGRVGRAAEKYGVDYVVVYKEMEIARSGLEIAFENDRFKVLRARRE